MDSVRAVKSLRLLLVVVFAFPCACDDAASKKRAIAEQEARWAAENARFREQVEAARQHAESIKQRLKTGYAVVLKAIGDGTTSKCDDVQPRSWWKTGMVTDVGGLAWIVEGDARFSLGEAGLPEQPEWANKPAGTLTRMVGAAGELYDLLYVLASEPKGDPDTAVEFQKHSNWEVSMKSRLKYLPLGGAAPDNLTVYVPSIDEAGKVDTTIEPEKDNSGRWISYFSGGLAAGRAYLVDLEKGELLCTAPVVAFNTAEVQQGTLSVDLGYNIVDAIDEQFPGQLRKPVN